MSESYQGGAGGPAGADPQQPSGIVDTAKQEAAEVKSTVTHEAGNVAETAKDEAVAVAQESKSQLKDLYAQSRQELTEQAAVQQHRVAEGLRSVGGELRSMADNADGGGAGADLVRQTSAKVSSVAEWIGDRDPGSLLNEVKSYARRKPGVFIAVAALAGLAAGRLTRALAESAADEKESSGSGTALAPTTDRPGPAIGRPDPGYGVAGDIPGSAGIGVRVDADIPPAPDGQAGDTAGTPYPGVGADTPVFDRTDAASSDPLREERP